jgi:RNA polymerase sigma-70 factor (ECF subfamily)
MYTTSVSLLERLRRPAEEGAWVRFVELYTPLLYYWARRLGLQEPDAADLVQDVLTTLVRKLPELHYDQRQSFRGWLRTVTLNTWRDHQRRRAASPPAADAPLTDLAGPEDPEAFAETEYRRHLAHRALHLVQVEFSSATGKAFWEHVVCGRPAAEVAAELGIRTGTVYVAKSRVLCRLRQELAGLLH